MSTLFVWINAFIPKTVANYTVTVPKGTYAGHTAVPMPTPGVLANPDAWPLVGGNPGYLTDQRDFSDDGNASVRMQSWAEIELRHDFVDYKKSNHISSGTVEVDLTSGDVMCRDNAVLTACTWRTKQDLGGRRLTLRVVGKGADPCVNLAANIDYSGKFVVQVYGGRVLVSFNGLLDEFPAFEAYTSFNGRTQQLFRSPPPVGNTVTDLLGAAWRQVSGDVSFDR